MNPFVFNRVSICLLMAALSGEPILADPDSESSNQDSTQGMPTERQKMTNKRIYDLLRQIDENVAGENGLWRLKVRTFEVSIITDERADRMRIIVPIADANQMNQKLLYRLLQANFDSALDARYCVAKGILWSAFIHPLGALDEAQFLSGLQQTVTLAATFGTSYSSGLLMFRGGDTNGLRKKDLIEQLKGNGQRI